MNSVRELTVARHIRFVTALGCALLAGVALAASDDGHREHDPHEHGHGALDIVLEGEELVAELRIPAVNVTGFEHAPRDDTEREAVREAVARFSNAAVVLVPNADAECEIEDVEAEIAGTDHDGHWRVGPQGEVEEGHEGEDHDADGHAKHEHEDEEHEEGHAKHEHEEESTRMATRSTSTRSMQGSPGRRRTRSCMRRIASTAMPRIGSFAWTFGHSSFCTMPRRSACAW